jgi:endonuclease-3
MRNSATAILHVLAGTYGTLEPDFPTDPYRFMVWWHCGYPQSQRACARGWASLTKATETEADDLLRAAPGKLIEALRPGGMAPELRAMRLKEIAERVLKEFGGDLTAALRAMSHREARAALVKFPGIANPGADRILLFGGMAPIAAVPSNSVHVLVRIEHGRERENYGVNYRMAQESIETAVPATFDARMQAYLLLRRHGQDICKRTNPKCGDCVLRSKCRAAPSLQARTGI